MTHIGIIPDGNRRWCKSNNILMGSKEYLKNWSQKFYNFMRLDEKTTSKKIKYLKEIKEVSFYVCSIDNIHRADNTRELIFQLLRDLYDMYLNPDKYISENDLTELIDLTENVQNFIFNSVKLNIIGEIDILPDDIKLIINDARELLNEGEYTVNLAFAYDFNKDLDNHGVNTNPNYNREQSNIDILFRSGNEKRTSGFFPTKTLYSEIFFNNKMWPEIDIDDIIKVIKQFKKRDRRFGK